MTKIKGRELNHHAVGRKTRRQKEREEFCKQNGTKVADINREEGRIKKILFHAGGEGGETEHKSETNRERKP